MTRLTQFFNDGYELGDSLFVLAKTPAYFGTSTSVPTITYANGNWVVGGYAYSKSEYPELADLIGDYDSFVFEDIVDSVNHNASVINSFDYQNNMYIALGASGFLATSSDLLSWRTDFVGTGVTPSSWVSVAYGVDLYVLISNGPQQIVTTSDFITYAPRDVGTTSLINAVTYGNGLFVAVGAGGVIRSSTDGVTWDTRTSGTSSILTTVTYANNLFLYGGVGGVLGTSTNGITWTLITSGTTTTITNFTYGNGIYLGVSGINAVTSTNGTTWNLRLSIAAASTLIYVTYGNGRFVSGAYSGTSGQFTTRHSEDGITWSTSLNNQNLQGLPSTGSTFNVIHDGSKFVGVLGTSVGNRISSSVDGIHWSHQDSSWRRNNTIFNIVYHNNTYYALSGFSSHYTINSSTDLVTWTPYPNNIAFANATGNLGPLAITAGQNQIIYQTQNYRVGYLKHGESKFKTFATVSTLSFKSYTYFNNRYYALNTSGFVMSSEDGLYWEQTATTITARSFTYDGSKFTLVGNAGAIRTTTNFTQYGSPTSNTTSSLLSVVYGSGLYVAVGNGGVIRSSTDGVTWDTRTSGTTSALTVVDHQNGIYVAGGTNGVLRSSTDGITWDTRTSGTSSTITQLAAGNNRFCFINSSRNSIVTSTDGADWIPIGVPTTFPLNKLRYLNGLYVVVGESGFLATSTDATSWTAQTTNTSSTLFDVTYGNALFVVTGNGGLIQSSTDGITWDTRTSGTTSPLRSVAYGNDVFVAAGNNALVTSTNGIAWTNLNSSSQFNGSYFTVDFSNNTFLVSGAGGALLRSTDGTNWDFLTLGRNDTTAGTGNGITKGNGLYVASPFNSSTPNGIIRTSTDGVIWTTRTSGTTSFISTITYLNGLYLFGTAGGGLSTSTDGISWTSRTSNAASTQLNSFTYDDNLLQYAYISTARIGFSSTGVTWTATATINNITVARGFVYANNKYTFMSSSGNLYTSTDLTNWTNNLGLAYTTLVSEQNLLGVTYDNNLYCAVGGAGIVITSTDADSWTFQTSNTTSTLNAVTYGAGLFVTVGIGGVVRSSTDGVTWDTRTSGTSSALNAVTYGNGLFVAVGAGGVIRSSTDGVTWDTRTSGTSSILNKVLYGNSLFVAAGAGGAIVTSTDGVTWTVTTSPTVTAITMLVYGNSTFVGTLGVSSQTMVFSTDGLTWRTTSTPDSLTTFGISGIITYDNTTFSAFDTNINVRRYAAFSSDGINYISTAQRNNNLNVLNPRDFVIGSNNTLVIVGDSLGVGKSVDSGRTFTFSGAPSYTINSFDYINNLYVATGSQSFIGTSTDGISWNEFSPVNFSQTLTAHAITYNDGLYIASVSTSIYSTTDFSSWNQVYQTVTSTSATIRVAYVDGSYLFWGTGNRIGTSTDGQSWYEVGFNASGATINNMYYADGKYVAVGTNGIIRSSTDGFIWNTPSSNLESYRTILDVTYDGTQFVAYAEGNTTLGLSTILVSTDADTWTQVGDANTTYSTGTISSALYHNNTHLIVADTQVGLSNNLTDWQITGSNTAGTFVSIDFINNEFVATNNRGDLLTSSDSVSWTKRIDKAFYSALDNSTAIITSVVYGSNTYILYRGLNAAFTTTDLTTLERFAGPSASSSSDFNITYLPEANTFVTHQELNTVGAVQTIGKNRYTRDGYEFITYPEIDNTVLNRSIYSFSQRGPVGFLAVGAGNSILTTTDGASLSSIYGNSVGSASEIQYIQGSYYLCGGDQITNLGSPGVLPKIDTSTDLVNWTPVYLDRTYTGYMRSMTYGNGVYLAVGARGAVGSAAGAPLIATSTDGITWNTYTTMTTLGSGGLTKALYGNGVFVVAGRDTIATSSDGINWVRLKNDYVFNSGVYTRGAFIEGIFYLCNATGLSTSTDGYTWIRESLSTQSSMQSIVYADGLFYTAAGNRIATSTDGLAWDPQNIISDTSIGSSINKIFYASTGIYLLTSASRIYTSTNGQSWTNRTSNTTSTLNDIAYGDSVYTMVGSGGVIITSSDSVTWTTRTSGTASTLNTVTFGSGVFVAGGVGGTILTSTNTTTWSTATSSLVGDVRLIYDGIRFVACNAIGKLVTSTNGTDWSDVPSSLVLDAGQVRAFKFLNSLYIITTITGHIFTSTDLIDWSRREGEVLLDLRTISINDIEYGNGRYVYVSSNGDMGTSTDGVSWSLIGTRQTSPINDIVYGNGVYICVSDSPIISKSVDGMNWDLVRAFSAQPTSVTFDENNQRFVVTLNNLTVFFSTDGENWIEQDTPFIFDNLENNGYTIYHNGKILHVTPSSGAVVASEDGLNWAPTNDAISRDKSTAVYGNGIYLIGSNARHPRTSALSAVVCTSTDGKTWNRVVIDDASRVYSSSFYNGVFIITDISGLIGTSTDGQKWKMGRFGNISTSSIVRGIVYDGNNYIGYTSQYIIGKTTTIDPLNKSTLYDTNTNFYVPSSINLPLGSTNLLPLPISGGSFNTISPIYATLYKAKP